MEELLSAVRILLVFGSSGDSIHSNVGSRIRGGPVVLQCIHDDVHVATESSRGILLLQVYLL